MYLGIDIGGTTIGIGILDEKENLVFYEKMMTPKSYDAKKVENSIIKSLKDNIREKEISIDSIKSIGIGIPGIVSKDRKKVIKCTNLFWKDIEFGKDIGKLFKCDSYLFNDATSAAFGEYKLGSMKGYRSGVEITLGTGVGGGIILDEKIFEGTHGIASEIGHIIVGESSYRCNCGRVGCLETFASGTALIKHINKLSREKDPINSAKEIFNLYEKENEKAVISVERFIKYLSIGIINIVAVLDPEIIVLAGGLSLSGDIYLDKLRKSVSDYRYFKEIPAPEIKLSVLGEKAGVMGASLLSREASSRGRI